MPKVAKNIKKTVKAVKRTDEKYTTLRKSLTAGTVCIMLAGRFRGRRVVMLKQLPSNGPLVVTGPYKVNGVPLRRVNAAYVIATSTKIDLSAMDTSKVTNDTFKRAKDAKRVKGEADFMGDKDKKAAEAGSKKTKGGKGTNGGKVSNERLALQKSVDTAVIAALKKDKLGKSKVGYLRSIFTLKMGDKPHAMKF